MAMEFLSGLHSMHWQTWVTPLVGLASVGLTLMLGRTFFRTRQAQAAPEQKDTCPDPFEFGSAAERRAAPRRGGKPVKILVSNETAEAEPEQGVIVNRSLTGLCMSFGREVPENSILSIRPANALADFSWLQVQVKRCLPTKGGEWELGCQFIRPPAWAVLLQLN